MFYDSTSSPFGGRVRFDLNAEHFGTFLVVPELPSAPRWRVFVALRTRQFLDPSRYAVEFFLGPLQRTLEAVGLVLALPGDLLAALITGSFPLASH